jgi:hypothetical protein
MSKQLPPSVEDYFEGKNARDYDRALSGFTASAKARDEGSTHEGPAEIQAWMEKTAAEYDDVAEVRSVNIEGDKVRVLAEVRGTFPGSPADLQFDFTLKGDKIAELAIGSPA